MKSDNYTKDDLERAVEKAEESARVEAGMLAALKSIDKRLSGIEASLKDLDQKKVDKTEMSSWDVRMTVYEREQKDMRSEVKKVTSRQWYMTGIGGGLIAALSVYSVLLK